MVRPCPHRIDCEGSDFPITNYSAEGPETNPLNPCLWFPGTWKEVGGLNLCVSEGGNPDDCFICAKKPKDPDPNKLCNEEQTCTVTCPGGTDVTFTVPAGTFCDTDSELPPPSPTSPTTPPTPPPLPPPPPALGITVQSTKFTPGVNVTDIVLRCVGLNPLEYYKITYTVTVPDSTYQSGVDIDGNPTYGIIPGFTQIRTGLFDHVGSTYDFTDQVFGNAIASVTNLSIKTTLPTPSLLVERVGYALNYSFSGMVVGISYTGEYEIDLFNNGNWLKSGFARILATASTYSGTDAFRFYSYPSAKVRGGTAWPIDENGNPIV